MIQKKRYGANVQDSVFLVAEIVVLLLFFLPRNDFVMHTQPKICGVHEAQFDACHHRS